MKREEGSFLIETMIALSLFVAGILGIVVLLTRSLALTSNVTPRGVAAYLAAEGIEVTKNIIDTEVAKGHGWNPGSLPTYFEVQYNSTNPTDLGSGVTESRRFLEFDPSNGTYSYDVAGTSQPTIFRRTITASSTGGNDVQVNAIVKWSVKGVEETLNIEDRFWNWRKAP